MKVSPCKGCEIRHLMCHSVCEHYIRWKAQREKALKAMYLDKEYAGYNASLSLAINNRRRVSG